MPRQILHTNTSNLGINSWAGPYTLGLYLSLQRYSNILICSTQYQPWIENNLNSFYCFVLLKQDYHCQHLLELCFFVNNIENIEFHSDMRNNNHFAFFFVLSERTNSFAV